MSSEEEVKIRVIDDKGPPKSRTGQSGDKPKGRNPLAIVAGILSALIVIAVAAVATGWYIWFNCRIEPATDEIVILIRKTGKDLKPGDIIAPTADYKGIQQETLPTGRYFYDTYNWDWEITHITDIPAGQLGVLTRLYGQEPPPGRIAVDDGYKGIVKDILRPGKYRINPYAYSVEIFDAISIRPGHIGVITSLDGKDALNEDLPPEMKNVYTVSKDVKGVQSRILDPGTYYINPFLESVTEVNIQSQRFEFSGDDAITFLTQDGFTVKVEGTMEFAMDRDQAPTLTHQVGDMDDILKKIILPRARGFSRIAGSKNPAVNFIAGETRQNFQDELTTHLKTHGKRWGIDIRSMLIRNITPPDEVAAIIRDREVALQNQKKIDQQIIQAKSQAELTRQEMLAEQKREKVESETKAIQARIQAEQDQSVKVIAAEREYEVAKVEAEAAKLQADAIMIQAGANRDVVKLQNEAEAAITAASVDAFGGGLNLARFTLYRKMAPQIGSILTTDREPGLGGIFKPLFPEVNKPEVNKGAEK